MTWHRDFIKRCLQSDVTINDALAYGVKIIPADPEPGQEYYKIIGIHHLLPHENVGNHHLYGDVLDAAGNRVYGAAILAQNANGNIARLIVDKPGNEPGTNAPIYWNDKYAVRVGEPISDAAENIHTRHPDEPGGNTLGHHSFYVVWQQVIAGSEPEPDPDPDPDPPPPEPPSDDFGLFVVFQHFGNEGWIPTKNTDDLSVAASAYRAAKEAGVRFVLLVVNISD